MLKERIKIFMGNVFQRQVGVFLIFLIISASLWVVSALNNVVQRQIDYNLRITNVPDSVIFITPPPETVTVSVVGRGSHMLRHLIGTRPTININFRKFQNGDRLIVSHSAMTEILQSRLGDERKIQEIYPDTIGIFFTTRPPVELPVRVAVKISTTPSVHLYGSIVSDIDSVKVYGTGNALQKIHYISTADTHFSKVESDGAFKVPLIVPQGCRAIPDSVTVRFKVEPYVIKDKNLKIQPVGVPAGMNMTFHPSEVTATFRVPKSKGDELPSVNVYADYQTITKTDSGYVRIYIEPALSYVFLEKDSVRFYLNSYNGTGTH